MRYDLIYTVDGANLMRDPAATVPQIGWTFGYMGQDWKIIDVYQDYTNWPREKYEIKVALLNELPKQPEPQKYAKCVQVWAQNKDKLSIGKSYPILYERGEGARKQFFIVRDDDKKRGYYYTNTQFTSYTK